MEEKEVLEQEPGAFCQRRLNETRENSSFVRWWEGKPLAGLGVGQRYVFARLFESMLFD